MNDKQFDVCVVGNVGIDTNVYLQDVEIDFSVEANFTENIDYVGQSGGYTSRGYAQLGYRTAFIGHVGDDHHAEFIRDEFHKDGIDTSAIFIDPTGTARSINFMYPDGRRKNFYDGKNHMHLHPDLEHSQQMLSRSRFVHFSIPNWARSILPIARDLELIIACDVQDVVTSDDPYRQDFISFSEFLCFSAVNHPDPTPLIEKFLDHKPNQVILVGMGAMGCALGWENGIEFFPAVEFGNPVVDTNGAGDSLAVGFLSSYLLEGHSIHESILRGQIAARHTCTQRASTSRLITRTEMENVFHQLIHNP